MSDELAGRVSMMTGKEELLKDGDVLIFCMRNYSYSDIGNIYIYIYYIYVCVFIYAYIICIDIDIDLFLHEWARDRFSCLCVEFD